ncbi:MAG TPA: hypothetical protein VKP13_05175 [Nitrospira sp.]|nr:hypothetical protein [Nitrospira sp.]
MVSRMALAVVGAFSISLLAVGSGGAVVCDPHCAPSQANKSGEARGLNRANDVAGVHGEQGRTNAAEKQDLHKPGGSGVVSDSGNTGSSTGGTTDTGGSTTGPCSGC